jgi:hypothetical protein
MDIETIKSKLAFYTGSFPSDAVRAAMEHPEAVTPFLLDALRTAADDPRKLEGEPSPMLHMYAMYLLAQFREPAAYPLLVKFFSTPGEISLNMTGDVVTEDLGRILASVCHNELEPLKRMIEDPAVNEYVRSACLRALTVLVVQGEVPRDEVVDYFRSLLTGKLEREPDFIWSALVVACCDLYPEELLPDIERAYDDDLVDRFYIRIDSIRQAIADGKAEVLRRTKERRRGLINDTIAEMSWWACFEGDARPPRAEYAPAANENVTKSRKIGRNDPCSCGSGKKYKKCCLH